MAKYYDFDAFMSERSKEKVIVKVYGEEYEVAKEIPAIVPVLMARYQGSADAEKQVTLLMRAADILLGKKNVDKLCNKGLSSNDLIQLIQEIFTLIRTPDEEDDEAQELSDDDGHKAVRGKSGKK